MKRHHRVPKWATPDQEKDNAALRQHYDEAVEATGDPEAVEVMGDPETGEHIIGRGLDLKPIGKLVAVLKGKKKS